MSAFLTEETVQSLGWMLLHSVWQGIAVAAGLVIARVGRRTWLPVCRTTCRKSYCGGPWGSCSCRYVCWVVAGSRTP